MGCWLSTFILSAILLHPAASPQCTYSWWWERTTNNHSQCCWVLGDPSKQEQEGLRLIILVWVLTHSSSSFITAPSTMNFLLHLPLYYCCTRPWDLVVRSRIRWWWWWWWSSPTSTSTSSTSILLLLLLIIMLLVLPPHCQHGGLTFLSHHVQHLCCCAPCFPFSSSLSMIFNTKHHNKHHVIITLAHLLPALHYLLHLLISSFAPSCHWWW